MKHPIHDTDRCCRVCHAEAIAIPEALRILAAKPPPTEEQLWRARVRAAVAKYQIERMANVPDTRRGRDPGEKRTAAARYVSNEAAGGRDWWS